MSSSISRLPDSATRLLSSHVVVVTPVQLVKELLDNAIDAKATSVEILVSPNTISKIEVRDDGVGIHPDDYDTLGRRAHTSKLRNIEELGTVVGKTLGFRGEALAGVNSMADVTITTKISTEPVAAVLQLIPNDGGILTQKSTSAPVGTTVTVTNLFCRQPVREQMATKEAKKTLDKLQDLLRSYAMARPQLKLQFKVLQASAKMWSYSPKRNATAIEAALQLFGAEAASKCFMKTFQTSHSGSNKYSPTQSLPGSATNGFVLEALLVNPGADLQKVPRGHYFAVDGRPMNVGRGVTKRLLNVYLEHLKLSTPAKSVNECFIRLDICCPRGTYDANIEPSKDSVLFHDEEVIVGAFRSLCSEVYGPVVAGHQNTSSASSSQVNGTLKVGSLCQGRLHGPLELRVKPKILDSTHTASQDSPKISPGVSCHDSKKSIHRGPQDTETSTTFKPINAEVPFNPLQSEDSTDQQGRALPSPNRWKVDTSVDFNERREPNDRREGEAAQPPLESREMAAITDEGPNTSYQPRSREVVQITGPGEIPVSNLGVTANYSPISPLTPEPPILRHIMAPPGDLDVPIRRNDAKRTKLHYSQLPTVPGGPYRNPMATPPNSSPRRVPAAPIDHSRKAVRHQHREQLPWTPPSLVKKYNHTDALQNDSTHSQGTDGFRQTQISFTGPQARRCQAGAQGDVPHMQDRSNKPLMRLEADNHSNIQEVFSKAKQNLQYQLSRIEDHELAGEEYDGGSQRHCQRPPRQRQPFSIVNTNTFRNSGTPKEYREPIATTLPIGDPRAYLLRRQKSMAAEESDSKLKTVRRLKSSLMPLENIPPEFHTGSLSWTANISSSNLDGMVKLARKYDEYIIYGTLVDGLDMSLADGRAVELRLRKLLTEQKENIGNGGAGNDQMIIGLQATLKGKGVGVASAT
ncbi:hypothetical protein F5Y10DRAFT_285643 [Nemania abortiva]|nr:hypothetical protein F5Y10DRAFT_285643 [Nemania abortiva]